MDHGEIVTEIQRRAAALGLLSHSCSDSRLCKGDRGYPDVVVAGPFGALFFEVKTGHDTLKPGQVKWMYQLLAGGELCLEIHERDLADDGDLDQLLEKIQLG